MSYVSTEEVKDLIDELPDMPALAPKGQPSNGGAPAGSLRPGADLETSAAAALMPEASACGSGCGCGSGGLGCEGVING